MGIYSSQDGNLVGLTYSLYDLLSLLLLWSSSLSSDDDCDVRSGRADCEIILNIQRVNPKRRPYAHGPYS